MLQATFRLYRNSFSGLSSETWLLSALMLINRSGTMVLPFMTLYMTSSEMGYTLSHAGLVVSIFGLGSILGAYLGGQLTDRIGFYKVQVFTLAMGGLLFIALGQIKSFPLICAFTFLLSTINEGFRPANSAAIGYYSSAEHRTRSYSLNRLAINLGWTVGTAIGGFFASVNYELLFWVDGLTNLLAVGFLLVFLRPRETPNDRKDKTSIPYIVLNDKVFIRFIFYCVLYTTCFFQSFTTVLNYFRDSLGMSESLVGIVMGINGIIIISIEMVLINYLEKLKKPMTFVMLGTLLCALAFFVLLLPGKGPLIAILMILLITVGEIISMPFMGSFAISRPEPMYRGQYTGLYSMSWSIGQTLGPVLCTRLVSKAGFEVMFILMGIILVISAFGFYSLRRNVTV